MRIHRLIAILALLESRGRMKARELAGALETSIRTVHRDLATLCESGIPIASIAGPCGGFELMSGYASRLHHLAHDEAVSLFGLKSADIIHRVGSLSVGENIVAIVCSAAHREEAFQGCRYVIEELKSRVPIWKKEIGDEGSRWVGKEGDLE